MAKGFPAGSERARLAGYTGGRANGLKRKRALLRTFLERWPLMGAEMLEAIYIYGQTRYYSGAQAKYRAGKASRIQAKAESARKGGLALAAKRRAA